MCALLEETKNILKENGIREKDVRWVSTEKGWFSWDMFKKVSDFDYNSGFGIEIINQCLIVVGDNWWLERHEYDGSEWWEFKELPGKPLKRITPNISDIKVN